MKTFENVSSLKDATLRAGQLVETKGYYSPGDGGGGRYLIKDTATVDGYVDHELAGGTFAVRVSITTFGTGTPEGIEYGKIGFLYTDLAGGAGTTLYVKESGTGNTGWVAK